MEKSPFVRALGFWQETVKLLLTLLSWTPASVLSPSVAGAKLGSEAKESLTL